MHVLPRVVFGGIDYATAVLSKQGHHRGFKGFSSACQLRYP